MVVDYDAFASSTEFSAYLDALARVDVDALREREQLALWINAYNAYTIEPRPAIPHRRRPRS